MRYKMSREMINEVFLEGLLEDRPEHKVLRNGSKLTTFVVSSHREYQVNGEVRQETSEIPCEMWGEKGEELAGGADKGDRLLVRGTLKLDKWDVDGDPRSKLKLKVFGYTKTVAINDEGGTQQKTSNIPF